MSASKDPQLYLRYTRDTGPDGEVSGWLVKEGQKLKQSKPRYLKLRNSKLSNHKTPTASPTWTASITDCSVGPGPRKYELLVRLSHRTVSFFAETEANFERWIVALKKASSTNINIEAFYKMGPVIGEGVNGEVVQGWDRATNEIVAIKTIPYDGNMSEGQDSDAEEEIRIVKSLDHANLVKTYDVFRVPKQEKIFIVMEFVAGGELHARVANEGGTLIKEGDAIRITRNILSAVQYLHDRNIVHRDIKLENVLCVEEDQQKPLQVKLADFGLSLKLSGKVEALSEVVGTGYYLAPEIIRKKEYGPSVDMWAIGILLYITLSGELPFFGDEVEKYCENALTQVVEFPDTEWKNISDAAKDFIRGLLEKNPEKRLTAREASKHGWVTDNSIADVIFEAGLEEEDEVSAPKTIFGKRKKTPSEILAKAKRSESSRPPDVSR